MGAKRARVVVWAAIAAVVLCSLGAGLFVFVRVDRPEPAGVVQTSSSPDGRWEVVTWFVGGERLGRPQGVLRVDVVGPAGPHAVRRTIYADPVPSRDAARRLLMWRDTGHIVLPLTAGGHAVLDVEHAPSQATPGSFASTVKATALATIALVAVLVAGVFGVLLLNTWLTRRRQARWEDWPVDWAHGRRRATRG
jgi:hypothetical protein